MRDLRLGYFPFLVLNVTWAVAEGMGWLGVRICSTCYCLYNAYTTLQKVAASEVERAEAHLQNGIENMPNPSLFIIFPGRFHKADKGKQTVP